MRRSSLLGLPLLALGAAVTLGGLNVSPARADDDAIRVKPPGVGVDIDRDRGRDRDMKHDMDRRDRDRVLRDRDDARSGTSVPPPEIIERDDRMKRDHERDRDKDKPLMRHDMDRDHDAGDRG